MATGKAWDRLISFLKPGVVPLDDDTIKVDDPLGARWLFAMMLGMLSFGLTSNFAIHDYSDGHVWLSALNGIAATAAVLSVFWSIKYGAVVAPTFLAVFPLLASLTWRTLAQGADGIPAAGWWLSVLPFVLTAAGFHVTAGIFLAVFIGCTTIIYTAPTWNLVALNFPSSVDPSGQFIAIVGSELMAVVVIVFSMCRHASIHRSLSSAKESAIDAAVVKSRFLANMSHEIRTPLLGLIGAIELMRSKSTSNAQRQQLITLAETSARTLHTLINDVLDYSKLDSGELQMETAPVSLHELCFQVNELFAVKAFDKGLELTTSIDTDVPARFEADGTRIKQLLSNLVSNAVKFTASGGVHIHLGVHQREEDDANSGDVKRPLMVSFSVSDTGIGIDPQSAAILFKPFAQADSSITRRFGGTGLGLSICAELAHAMGGVVELSSNPGKGSTFTFRAPLVPCAPPPTPVEAASGGCVLVATTSLGLEAHVCCLLEQLGREHRICSGLPSPEQYLGFSSLVLDSTLLNGLDPAVIVGRYSSAGLHVVLLHPLGSDNVVGLFGASSNVSMVHKPVRKRSLRKALEPLSRLNQAVREVSASFADSTQPLRTTDFQNVRILVAEDNPVNQVVIEAMLAEIGASCTIVSNGAEAVEAFANAAFDLVLMDLQMPVMGGIESARAIRDHEAGLSNVPIIAMTANSERDDTDARQRAGMSGYLGKPFRLADIKEVLQTWCGNVAEAEAVR